MIYILKILAVLFFILFLPVMAVVYQLMYSQKEIKDQLDDYQN